MNNEAQPATDQQLIKELRLLQSERAQRQREEAEQFTARLHREYFQPFDKLLERKAEYALKIEAEKGAIPPRLLEEIEILEKFRGYMEQLESGYDELTMTTFHAMQAEIDRLNTQIKDLFDFFDHDKFDRAAQKIIDRYNVH